MTGKGIAAGAAASLAGTLLLVYLVVELPGHVAGSSADSQVSGSDGQAGLPLLRSAPNRAVNGLVRSYCSDDLDLLRANDLWDRRTALRDESWSDCAR